MRKSAEQKRFPTSKNQTRVGACRTVIVETVAPSGIALDHGTARRPQPLTVRWLCRLRLVGGRPKPVDGATLRHNTSLIKRCGYPWTGWRECVPGANSCQMGRIAFKRGLPLCGRKAVNAAGAERLLANTLVGLWAVAQGTSDAEGFIGSRS